MSKLNESIKIVGIGTITTNDDAQNQNTIAKIWDEFLKTPLKEKLTGISSSSVFAVYSDYENGYKGKYKITIGYAVNEISNMPNELTTVTIPAGKYKIFKSKSRAPEDIVDVWKMIWQIDSTILKPNFVTTFEEYKDNEVTIYIGHD